MAWWIVLIYMVALISYIETVYSAIIRGSRSRNGFLITHGVFLYGLMVFIASAGRGGQIKLDNVLDRLVSGSLADSSDRVFTSLRILIIVIHVIGEITILSTKKTRVYAIKLTRGLSSYLVLILGLLFSVLVNGFDLLIFLTGIYAPITVIWFYHKFVDPDFTDPLFDP